MEENCLHHLLILVCLKTYDDYLGDTGWPLVRGNLIFLQGQGKAREFCRLVREILNTKKVGKKSGNFITLAQNMCCSRYFDYMYLKCEKSVDFYTPPPQTMFVGWVYCFHVVRPFVRPSVSDILVFL